MDPILVAKLLGTVGYMALEYWLGKTDKVKAGSTLELVVNVLKFLKPTLTKEVAKVEEKKEEQK